ncbi:fimbrial protein [[Enterobacter] lignolyticus]|uniref:Ferrous iron transporter B n=1 Tax=[Enterobacter] lignolyticus TaxID=1334193 RepID=A0A806XBD3_9ENTR|nr:fimbrial protein [[Enterobacter] lignolyticus]ALR76089.1 ferrous iron transporter B [[Enterobacter] lignolyticus]
MKIVKLLSMLIVLCASWLLMPQARASCTSPNIPSQIQLPDIRVSSLLAPGSTIPGTEQTVTVHGSCDSADDGLPVIACYYGSGAESAGFPGVYDTGVAGIGITLINAQGQRIRGSGIKCDTRGTPLGYISTDGAKSFNFTLTLALVKTSAQVGSGALDQAQTVFGLGVFDHEGIGSPNHVSYAGNVTFSQVTCAVTPQSLSITLGDFPVSDFTHVGATTAAKEFDISLLCNDTVQPEVMISSANGYESSYPGVVKLTPENGAAGGVGIEMTFDGMAATFDRYEKTAGLAYSNQTLQIPFTARYYQTAGTVTPGPANGVATLTLAYQ